MLVDQQPMDDDDPFLAMMRPAAAETLEAASARLKPVQKISGRLYRVVEVVRAPNGRVSRIGQIWHSDLERVRRFGRALAANTVGEHVQVADSAGAVIETIPTPPPGTPPLGWGNWRAVRLPSEPARPLSATAPARVTAKPSTSVPRPPPTMVPPILPPALPAAPGSAVSRAMSMDLPVMAPERMVEITNPLPPTHV